MTLDIYAAKLENGTYGPVMGFEHSDKMIVDVEKDMLVPNPQYVPGVSMNMSSSNFHYMLFALLKVREDDLRNMDLKDIRTRALNVLETINDDRYWVIRMVELINICDLGIARGAERLTWI